MRWFESEQLEFRENWTQPSIEPRVLAEGESKWRILQLAPMSLYLKIAVG